MAADDYVTWTQVTALIPERFATEALDDDKDGEAEMWEPVRDQACQFVDGCLSPRYATPVANPNALIREAALYKVIALMYGRRGMAEENPYRGALSSVSAKLRAIGAGDQPLDPGAKKTNSPAVAITEEGGTYSESGRIAT